RLSNCRTQGPRAASRDGGTTRLRAVRTLGGRGGRQGCDRRGWPGIRSQAVWRPDLLEQHARIRLDPFAAAGGLHRRQDETVPSVVAGEYVRSPRVVGGQLLFR